MAAWWPEEYIARRLNSTLLCAPSRFLCSRRCVERWTLRSHSAALLGRGGEEGGGRRRGKREDTRGKYNTMSRELLPSSLHLTATCRSAAPARPGLLFKG